jgi:hypothetical protein
LSDAAKWLSNQPILTNPRVSFVTFRLVPMKRAALPLRSGAIMEGLTMGKSAAERYQTDIV